MTMLTPPVKNVIKYLQTMCICFGRVHLCVATGLRFSRLTDVTGTLLEPNAITALFGIPQLPLSRLQADLIAFGTLLTNEVEITNTAFAHCG